MSFLRTKRHKIFVLGGTAVGLVVTVAAIAYFTGANGSGTDSAAVGSSTAWSVAVNSGGATFTPAGYTAIYPGSGIEAIPFTVTNSGKGSQNLRTLAYAIKNDGASPANAETSTGTVITGCQAAWFTATGDVTNAALPSDLAAGGTYTGKSDRDDRSLAPRVALREHGLEIPEELLDVPGVERRRHDEAEVDLVVVLFASGSNRDGDLAAGLDVR